jgi:hypothetical protein
VRAGAACRSAVVGIRQHFRPEVPEGAEDWGAKALLDIGRIRKAAD